MSNEKKHDALHKMYEAGRALSKYYNEVLDDLMDGWTVEDSEIYADLVEEAHEASRNALTLAFLA